MQAMRTTKFLRTPIRADHQARLTNLAVAETALAGNPLPPGPAPQTLELTFGVQPNTTEVQIAPLWQGELWFLSDDKSANPKKASDVIPANFPAWKVVGDLVLYTDDRRALQDGFATGAPLIGEPPALVRYSKVKLTQAFLFTTLKANPFDFVDKGGSCKSTDTNWFERLLISFLDGRTGLPCPHDTADETKDFARKDMPSVSLASSGNTTFRITIASQAVEANDKTFWLADSNIDSLVSVPLVPPSLANDVDRLRSPLHPAASVISSWALFQSAEGAGGGAFASDQTATPPLPLRTVLGGARPDSLPYRRLELRRPPVPGTSSSFPRRLFPMHHLNVRPNGGSPDEIRIPLSGQLYLPLDDGDYDLWASERGAPGGVSQEFRLSIPGSPTAKLTHGEPQLMLSPLTLVTADEVVPVNVHTRHYDGLRAFWAFGKVNSKSLGDKAKGDFGDQLEVQLARVFPVNSTNVDYAEVYGWVRQSAGRHGLAPEFLHAVVWREGIGQRIDKNLTAKPRVAYTDLQEFDLWSEIGLDQVLIDRPTLTAGPDPYVDSADMAGITPSTTAPFKHPEDPTEMVWTGSITGWREVIEIVAGELQWRLDTMLVWCGANGVKVTTEKERRFLAYSRYNGRQSTAQTLAASLRTSLSKFSGAKPTVGGPTKVRFNTLGVLATAQYLEQAGVYR